MIAAIRHDVVRAALAAAIVEDDRAVLDEEAVSERGAAQSTFLHPVAEHEEVRNSGPATVDHEVGLVRGALRVSSAARRR